MHIVGVALIGEMFGCKVKLTLLCVAWFVIVFHWSEASRYDDENEENVYDSRRSELIDDMESEDSQPLRGKIVKFRPRQRRTFQRLAFGLRRRSRRRRKSWRW